MSRIRARSDLSRIVGPVQQRLALPAAAIEIARFTVLPQLRHVATNGAPTRNLTQIIFAAAPAIITAVPLEPAARIIWVNPTFTSPLRERLRCIHAEEIQKYTWPIWRKLGPREPARRKFLPAIGHIFPAKHAELEHLSRRQVGRESPAESAPHRFRAKINVSLLDFVVHFHPHGLHADVLTSFLSFRPANQPGLREIQIE